MKGSSKCRWNLVSALVESSPLTRYLARVCRLPLVEANEQQEYSWEPASSSWPLDIINCRVYGYKGHRRG